MNIYNYHPVQGIWGVIFHLLFITVTSVTIRFFKDF